MAAFKIVALQKALDSSVPVVEFEKVNKQYYSLTEKYRDILERGNSLISETEKLEGLKVE